MRCPTFLAAILTLPGFLLLAEEARAGDILRGGSIERATPAAGSRSPEAGAEARSQASSKAQDLLARTTQAVRNMEALQAAARALASAPKADPNRPGQDLPEVPNGLRPGGLWPDPAIAGDASLWRGASAPSEQAAGGQLRVNVMQHASQAFLHWETFNIGRETALVFDQSAGGAEQSNWTVFNFVRDPGVSPSQLLGALQAPGQVYLMNRNGVIFGPASSVNTRGLTVSSLPINRELVDRGILNNPDSQFLFSAYDQPAGAAGTPQFTASDPHPGLGRFGDVWVTAGARLESPLAEDGQTGGRISLLAPNVHVEGSLVAPNGQVIVAAGHQFGFAAHRSDDPSLRGLNVYVGQVAAPAGPAAGPAGQVRFSGALSVPRGSAVLAGADLAVDGVLTSTTSVSLNGRIDILAAYDALANPETSSSFGPTHVPFLITQSGKVRLGPEAVIEIRPEWASDEKVAAEVLALRSQVSIQGKNLQLGEDSTVHAPSGSIVLEAGRWVQRPVGGRPESYFVASEGVIELAPGAVVSAAGTAGAPVPATRNLLEVDLRGSELADSPLQREGSLRGSTVVVDARKSGVLDGRPWVGTPLAEVSGYLGLIERDIGELTTPAGDVTLRAGSALLLHPGSSVDVSAGWIEFSGGPGQTSRLLLGGRVVDIATADLAVSYQGIYRGVADSFHARWGVLRSFAHALAPLGPVYQHGYVWGASGGSLSLASPQMALAGSLAGTTTYGDRQRTSLPTASSLRIALETRDATVVPEFLAYNPTPPDLSFRSGAPLAPDSLLTFAADGSAILPGGLWSEQIQLDPSILGEKSFGQVSVTNYEGGIEIPAEVRLDGPARGSLTLVGANLILDGSILIPGGSVELLAMGVSKDAVNRLETASTKVNPTVEEGRGLVALGPDAVIDLSGLLVDERAGYDLHLSPRVISGGQVRMEGTDLRLVTGSVIDVSGGARIAPSGARTFGSAGAIKLAAGRDPVVTSAIGGDLVLQGELRGFSGARPGTLEMLAPAWEIGGEGFAGTNVLGYDFFDQGGFGSFRLSGIGIPTSEPDIYRPGLHLSPGVALRPQVASQRLRLVDQGAGWEWYRFLPEEGLRSPVSIAFGAVGASDPYARLVLARGETVVSRGSVVDVGPGGSITLFGDAVAIHGKLSAPGGAVQVSAPSTFATNSPVRDSSVPTVHLSSSALLDASGTVVLLDDPRGWRTGSVLPGGSISLSGNLLLEPNATLLAAGAAGSLDLPALHLLADPHPPAIFSGFPYRPMEVESAGGSISLRGAELLVNQATMAAPAGGANAPGGSLSLSSGRFYADGVTSTTADVTLTVTASLRALDTMGQVGVGIPVSLQAEGAWPGGGIVAVDSFSAGGFAHLRFGGGLRFDGDLNLEVPGHLRLADRGVLEAEGEVVLSARHITIGQDWVPPSEATQEVVLFTQNIPGLGLREYRFSPVSGSGHLDLQAGGIDVGTLALQRVSTAKLTADGGDIRGSGSFSLAGDLTLQAAQIYPATASSFVVSAYGSNTPAGESSGTISVERAGDAPSPPLSAGGSMELHASGIVHEGRLVSPYGSIRLGRDGQASGQVDRISGQPLPVAESVVLASGSETSLTGSAAAPFGSVLDGTSWIDPRGTDITRGDLPDKVVTIAARSVVTEAGSVVDTRGGGDLFAYRWIPGLGGSTDILAGDTVFAVLPGLQPSVAPVAPYNPNPSLPGNLSGDRGYTNPTLSPGQQVFLEGVAGLPTGYYTLLPARYALLPGAFLVAPKDGGAVRPAELEDGTLLTYGFRVDGLTGTARSGGVPSRFAVLSGDSLRERVEYAQYSANQFLADIDAAGIRTSVTLPQDSGRMVLSAAVSLELRGSAMTAPSGSGRGGMVDIDSPLPILIAPASQEALNGVLVLDPEVVSAFGAASLLVGGRRQVTAGELRIVANSPSISVNNSGHPLTGQDILLVARQSVELGAGADLRALGAATDLPTHTVGDPSVPGSGNGALLRVSVSESPPPSRAGLGTSPDPVSLRIGAEALVSGVSVVYDSSADIVIDDGARTVAESLALGAGRINLVFDPLLAPSNPVGLSLFGESIPEFLGSAAKLTLLSYSTVDLYGSGQVGSADASSLVLRTPAVRAFAAGGGEISFLAREILLDNPSGPEWTAVYRGSPSGTLSFTSHQFSLGEGKTVFQGITSTRVSADESISLAGDGDWIVQGAVTLLSPALVAEAAISRSIQATGVLEVSSGGAPSTPLPQGGLGASLTLSGASVSINTGISLPSGRLEVRAATGDVSVGVQSQAYLDVSGETVAFFDQVRSTRGGEILLTAAAGSVLLGTGATVDFSADADFGEAGSLVVASPGGRFEILGDLFGGGAAGGSFSLDTGAIPGGSTAAIDRALNEGGVDGARSLRVRSGDVVLDGPARAGRYALSVDGGDLRVSSVVDASGVTGGWISLSAAGSVVLEAGSVLSVAAEEFNSAQKGGSVRLEAGAAIQGASSPEARLSLLPGSAIELGVAAASAQSAARGQSSGTLTLRAPRTADGRDVAVDPLGGSIAGAAHVAVEGFSILDLGASGGALTPAVLDSLRTSGSEFVGADGSGSPGYEAMVERILGSAQGTALADSLVVLPGFEIHHPGGDLTLGSSSSSSESDWDLSAWRFGPLSAPGNLVLRASGNLVFLNALSDGFSGGESLWLSPLSELNPLLPPTLQSWSYRLVAGADFAAADTLQVVPPESVGENRGSLLLGKNAGAAIATGGSNAQTESLTRNFFQVIRTGTGSIEAAVSRDLRLLNPFAGIYTAGVAVPNPDQVVNPGDFHLPQVVGVNLSQGSLGAVQQQMAAQYGFHGGDVSLTAGRDIQRLTVDTRGNLLADLSRQVPSNWLYRRGFVGNDGQFGTVSFVAGLGRFDDPAASTTWWVDYSNFFQGVGALGGGNVSLTAGRDISNVDAVIPTNARYAMGVPDASRMVELGGGDLEVCAGRDISGGLYYVERGNAALSAGRDVTTNAARSHALGVVGSLSNPQYLPESTWMPTALFLGKGGISVTARGDVLLGPVANPFLLPVGLNNRFWYKSYFSTYAPQSSLTIASLGGDVTLRNMVTLPDRSVAAPSLQHWMERHSLQVQGGSSAAHYQPWLRLAETTLEPFGVSFTLLPPSLFVTAFSGDLVLGGSFQIFPAPRGTVELLSTGRIQALSPVGESSLIVPGENLTAWNASQINLSDTDPRALPQPLAPFAYYSVAGSSVALNNQTQTGFLRALERSFEETGATNAVLQTKQLLHAPGLLHLGDDRPAILYAAGGDLEGLEFFSSKAARVVAAGSISDVGLYLQHLSESDRSLVAAGSDLAPFQVNSTSRVSSRASGNTPNQDQTPLSGDIQLGGPGVLEVLAGRDLDLGISAGRGDGTFTGITTVGNRRNPYLPSTGASIVAAAGIGPSLGIGGGRLDFESFVNAFLDPATAPQADRWLAELADLGGFSPEADAWESFQSLPPASRQRLSLEMFFRVLRQTGRDFNDPESDGFRKYDNGFEAIAALFPEEIPWDGNISLTARQIKTAAGGSITLLAPGGGVTVGLPVAGARADQGILTEAGGDISIFSHASVAVGTSRIFTLRGGNEIIWSSTGDIAAGSSAKTVKSAPPTRVIVDLQTGAVQTDLSGLATGGGIGALQTVPGVPPSDIDLIAPAGIIDAGDAGIRVSGNLSIAAVEVINAGNIQVGGASGGVPSTSVSVPDAGGLSAASAASGAVSSGADSIARQQSRATARSEAPPSIINVEILGYGGGDPDEEDQRRNRQEAATDS